MKLKRILLAVYWILLFIGTHLPPSDIVAPVLNFDKAIHFFAYFILGFLLGRSENLGQWSRFIYGLILLTIYASVDELTQPYFGRSSEWLDGLADFIGSASGLLWAKRFQNSASFQVQE